MLRLHLKTCHPLRSSRALRPLLVVGLLSSSAGGAEASPVPEVVRARWLMGTVLEVRLPAGTADVDAVAEEAFRAVRAVEDVASLWKPGTELAAVHAMARSGGPAVLSETLGDLVARSLEVATLTGGAFSPAVGALVEAYDLRGEGRWPTAAEAGRAADLARLEGVRYDSATRTLALRAGVTLDLDGIAKGFALDRAAEALRKRGIEDALLNFGGQLLAIGPPHGSPARRALVASPSDPDVPVLSVPLRNASVSTSSNSERAREVAGRRAGHLLDPRTGDLVDLVGSVSVLARDGAIADALSTAWAVEGPDAHRRSDPSSDLRRAGAVAFVPAGRDHEAGGPVDPPFVQLLPPPGHANSAARPH